MSTVIDGSASVTINSGVVLGITSGTAVASTSGASIDFTGLPAWVKRITVMLNGVSTNGTSNYLIQLGAGSITSTGYVSVANNGAGSGTTSTSGFVVTILVGLVPEELRFPVLLTEFVSPQSTAQTHSMPEA